MASKKPKPVLSNSAGGGEAIRSLLICSANSFSVRRGTSPWRATFITWNRSSVSLTIGCSASSGKVSIRSTAFLISSRTDCSSAQSSISTVTIPTPSAAVPRTSSVPSTSAIASSIRSMTLRSTSAGVAPGNGTSIATELAEISGKSSSFVTITLSSPAKIRKKNSRFAATWFRANHAIMPPRGAATGRVEV